MAYTDNIEPQSFSFEDGMVEMLDHITKFLRKSTLAETTKKLYEHYLVELRVYIWSHKLNWETITDDNILDFLDENKSWSSSTRHTAAYSARAFYLYAFGSNHPIANIKVRRDPTPPQRTLDWDGLSSLLESFDTSTPKGIRDLSIITMLVDTGLRASEICNAQMKYLNLRRQKFDVLIKGNHWESASYFDYTASCLDAWLSIRPQFALRETTTIYCSIKGLKPGTQLTKDGLRGLFRRFGDLAGLGLISPHDMRRTFATLSSLAGAPSRVVQVSGRWSSIQMVEHYTKALSGEAMRPYSPINRLMMVGNEKESHTG